MALGSIRFRPGMIFMYRHIDGQIKRATPAGGRAGGIRRETVDERSHAGAASGLALTPEGWRRDVRLVLAAGAIESVDRPAPPPRRATSVMRSASPAPPICTATRSSARWPASPSGAGSASDNFWSWRETMYRFALAMSPDHMEAVAAQAYVEMLEAGYTRVGEFHYLHHAPDGRAYADIARDVGADRRRRGDGGIGLTLLPVFYAHSGFGGAAPGAAQRRFLTDLDGYARIVEAAETVTRGLDGAEVGLAPHSLRAVTPGELAAVDRSRRRPAAAYPCRRADRRKSTPASPGRARARCNGCSTTPPSTRAGASSTRPT